MRTKNMLRIVRGLYNLINTKFCYRSFIKQILIDHMSANSI